MKTNDAEQKYVLYIENGHIKGTDMENRRANIQNARGIIDFTLAGFQNMDEVREYCEKYMKVPVVIETSTTDLKDSGNTHVCCICGKKFSGYGNNPWPIKKTGVCCDSCNWDYVIPARANMAPGSKDIHDSSDAPFALKTREGFPIISWKMDSDGLVTALIDGRTESFPEQYIIGFGYDVNDGQWENGHYFMDKAEAEKEFNRLFRMKDSMDLGDGKFTRVTKNGYPIRDMRIANVNDRPQFVVIADVSSKQLPQFCVGYGYDSSTGEWESGHYFPDFEGASKEFLSLKKVPDKKNHKADSVIDMDKEIWEGWTIHDFIDSISDSLASKMDHDPFDNPEDMKDWIHSEQPYYKKAIPDVDEYFVRKYFH